MCFAFPYCRSWCINHDIRGDSKKQMFKYQFLLMSTKFMCRYNVIAINMGAILKLKSIVIVKKYLENKMNEVERFLLHSTRT